MVMVMLVPAATLTVQTYEPEAPDWLGRVRMGAAETWPAGRTLRRTVPTALFHWSAAGSHSVSEGGELMVGWAATAAARTTAPAAAVAILTILKIVGCEVVMKLGKDAGAKTARCKCDAPCTLR